ncbi:hypothetical protein [Microbacterium sp. SORGH_AS_0888]|uniref:hypothetical protein n=1 Tax=Microbacterium sp. SORGH_AS_0888 TaxID=3041791 RepID=UPI002787BD65|nr:hypothetical protein [Microbacterium sp. SORGH_AS_0888]MDQ1127936.1 hypothetical protein [Microbacterium sp. SORGH_AS_0888]
MRWERLFEDLQTQFASEWEAERAVLDTEAERLRLARLPLRSRLRALVGDAATIEVVGGEPLRGTLTAAGEDWLGVDLDGGAAGVVRTDAIAALAIDQEGLLHSAREDARTPRSLAERMSFGFVARDLARRRVTVGIHRLDGAVLTGTIDRAGADHLDLARHDPDVPRRAAEVTGFRLLPFAAIGWMRLYERPA